MLLLHDNDNQWRWLYLYIVCMLVGWAVLFLDAGQQIIRAALLPSAA